MLQVTESAAVELKELFEKNKDKGMSMLRISFGGFG